MGKRKKSKAKKRSAAINKRKIEQRTKQKKQNDINASFPSSNAKLIFQFMKTNKIKGDYRDYVLISGDRLINWDNSYNCETKNIEKDGIKLVHKRNLKNILSEENAAVFWHPKLGRQR